MALIRVIQHRNCTLHHRSASSYLLNVGRCGVSISLVYVKFHSDLQYVRNHRNSLVFVFFCWVKVSCELKWVMLNWVILLRQMTGPLMQSVLEKREKKKILKIWISERCDIFKDWGWFFYYYYLLSLLNAFLGKKKNKKNKTWRCQSKSAIVTY